MQQTEVIKLANLLPDSESQLKGKLLRVNDSIELEIITPEKGEEIIELARSIVKQIVDPDTDNDIPKVRVPCTNADLTVFKTKYGVEIILNEKTGKYDVVKNGEHKFEFETNADKKTEVEPYFINV